ELWSAVSIPVERLILQIVVVCGVETQALFVREVYVRTHRVFPLVERVPLGAKPVTVPSNERVRGGPHIKNPDSVGAQTIDGNNVDSLRITRCSLGEILHASVGVKHGRIYARVRDLTALRCRWRLRIDYINGDINLFCRVSRIGYCALNERIVRIK